MKDARIIVLLRSISLSAIRSQTDLERGNMEKFRENIAQIGEDVYKLFDELGYPASPTKLKPVRTPRSADKFRRTQPRRRK